MHVGRFQTIDEVIDHYNSGGKISPNINPLMHKLQLSEAQKADLKAFILTLTDSTALTNPAFQNPF
jgi:cytochrome c peroxidase